MNIYESLGLKPLINAAGTYTAIGGSKMSENTANLMKEASRHFIDIRELQKAVNNELAKLTNNEAAAVCNGAASGLYICCATCVSLLYNKSYNYLSKEDIEKPEFIVFRAHRNPYDWGLKLMNVKMVELGFPNIIMPVSEEELEANINKNTAAIFFAYSGANGWIADGELSLKKTVEIASRHNIPVIVDAAAQLPPKENLWRLTRDIGATAALFSGGKELRGPQSSGLIVGKKNFIDYFVKMNFPNYGPGRMLKTGREEIIGLYNAVKEYIEEDTNKRIEWCEKEVNKLVEYSKQSELFLIERAFPNEASQPIPRALVKLKKNSIELSYVVDKLLNMSPAVFTSLERGKLFISPTCLYDGEMEIIIKHLDYIEKNLNK